jgi:hypothetical protein
MAAFLTRALDLPASSVNAFVDDEGSIFEADIDALAAAGITKGCNPPDNDEYCPNALVTRAQMASFLGRGLGLAPVAVAARPEVVPGMLWSVDLFSPDPPADLSMGWQVAFADTGIAAAGGSSVVFSTPVEGRWEAEELVRTHPDFEEGFPLGLAASGGRVVATAYGHAPVVYVFEKVGGVWVDTRIPLPYTGGFDGAVAIDGDRIVARWGPLEFVELMWTGSGWEHCLFTIDVVDPDAGPGPIALQGDVVAFGDPYADAAYAARWDGATWVVSRLSHPWAGEMFGSSVDVDGGRILVGANGESAGPGGPAGVYLYTWDGSAWRGRVVAAGDSGFGDEARLSGDTVITLGESADSASFWVFRDDGAAWDGYEIELASAPLLARLALRGSLGMATVPPTAFGPAAMYLFELP